MDYADWNGLGACPETLKPVILTGAAIKRTSSRPKAALFAAAVERPLHFVFAWDRQNFV
jgi:hypothetical protein